METCGVCVALAAEVRQPPRAGLRRFGLEGRERNPDLKEPALVGLVHEVGILARSVPGSILILKGLETRAVIVECVLCGRDDVVVVAPPHTVGSKEDLAAIERPDAAVPAGGSGHELVNQRLIALEPHVDVPVVIEEPDLCGHALLADQHGWHDLYL